MKLRIQKFSCIESAELETARLTILIGPQASGKSVVSKLQYFFQNAIYAHFTRVESDLTIERYKEEMANDFRKWFPPSAWGTGKFLLEFSAGPVTMSITRRGRIPSEKLNIKFSPYFEEQFTAFVEAYRAKEAAQSRSGQTDPSSFSAFDMLWRLQSDYRKRFEKDLGADYAAGQLFVPAGRSFFTSIGKAVAAFEQSGMLDPVTVRFGRFFANAREHGTGRSRYMVMSDTPMPERREDLARELFGGELKFERELEYVATEDGRKVPFSALSSGQQELLPLWLTLDFSTQFSSPRQITYIEEPEAHLFPSAQSMLVKYLVQLITARHASNKMLLTTHSPYILSQINNLLKAGMLGAVRSRPLAPLVEEVLPKDTWLRARSTTAYAIIDRKLVPIMDSYGLIDGGYIDEVSGKIAEEFTRLMEIESGA